MFLYWLQSLIFLTNPDFWDILIFETVDVFKTSFRTDSKHQELSLKSFKKSSFRRDSRTLLDTVSVVKQWFVTKPEKVNFSLNYFVSYFANNTSSYY